MSPHDEGADQCTAISAARIFDAIAACFADCDQTPQTLIQYALCDLRHLCDLKGLDFADCDRRGYTLYLEESRGADQ